ncbi:MAG: hypothetical protein H6822_18485 [Planctomycetaceae bacterium]|nr:hypothetical protein [Planctomycetales bacterium]MCB9924175.1 hypothetical protein [Planctomycetaceae bacterium]
MKKEALFATALVLASVSGTCFADAPRSEAQQNYAESLWTYVSDTVDFTKWKSSDEASPLEFAPPAGDSATTYYNAIAQEDGMPRGAVLVTEHRDAGGEKVALTVAVRAKEGYNSRTRDWYWAHFLADGTLVKTCIDKSPHSKRGFVTFEADGRLWVFGTNSSELKQYLTSGELAKHVIRPGAGPGGITLKAPDAETIDRFLTLKDGFITKIDDGRLWVFRKDSEELKSFEASGELAKHVIRPNAGPGGMTIKAPDNETILEYLATRDGFHVTFDSGRIWVFRASSPELAEFQSKGEPAKHVIRPGAGPLGVTVKGPDAETIDQYLN